MCFATSKSPHMAATDSKSELRWPRMMRRGVSRMGITADSFMFLPGDLSVARGFDDLPAELSAALAPHERIARDAKDDADDKASHEHSAKVSHGRTTTPQGYIAAKSRHSRDQQADQQQ